MRWSHMLSHRVLLTTVLVGLYVSACKETVTEPIAVGSVTVTGGGGTLRLGQSAQLTTTLKSTEGWTLPNVGVTWTSSDAAKATISPSGQVTAVSRGPVTLTAAAGGVTGTGTVTVIGVQSIALAPETLSVIVTQTRPMTATTVLDAGVTVTPTWRSLDTTIAKVDTTGRVTAKSTTGLARIEVTAEDKKDTAMVRVIPVPVVSVVVTPDTATRGPGQTVQLTATPKDSIGGTLIGRTVTWSSSDASKATVSTTGLVTGVATGAAVITATIEGRTATSNITIRVPINEIALTQSSCTGSGSQSGTTARLYTTETCQYSATPRDAAGNTLLGRNLTWSVSDTTVAKLDGAAFAHPTTQLPTVKLLPQKGGTVSLTVSGEGKSTTLALSVLAPIASVAVSPATATLNVGATKQLIATLRDAAGSAVTGRAIAWTSTDSTKATVTSSGLVRAIATGTVEILAGSEGKTAKSQITIQQSSGPDSDGWVTYGLHRYKYISAPGLSWTDSRALARSNSVGSDLATLETADEREFISNYLGTIGVRSGFLWIGMFQNRNSPAFSEPAGGWMWVTGQALDENEWLNGEPNNNGPMGAEDHAAFDLFHLKWNDVADSDKGSVRGYLVEISGATEYSTIQFSPLSGSLAVGNQSCAIDTEGKAYCWGLNSSGELGDGSTVNRLTPTLVTGSVRFISIAVAQRFTCGLSTDSLAYCWGTNSEGQLGTGSYGSSSVPVAVTGGHRFVSLVGTGRQMCALTSAGTGYCWGHNPLGEVGDGTTTRRNVPTAVLTNEKFSALHAADFVTCGLTLSSKVLCWGDGQEGRTGSGSSTMVTTPIPVSGDRTYESLSTSGQSSCARRPSGEIDCWGVNRSGEFSGSLTNVLVPTATTFSGVLLQSVSIGIGFGCGLIEGGTAYCWGTRPLALGVGVTSSTFTAPTAVSLPESATRVVAGSVSACAITLTGRLFCWGENSYGQVGDGTTANRNTPREVGISAIVRP
jgi:uncharacterized protein YjdB/alpha-tubulin suppressor-like RCC1 family protein